MPVMEMLEGRLRGKGLPAFLPETHRRRVTGHSFYTGVEIFGAKAEEVAKVLRGIVVNPRRIHVVGKEEQPENTRFVVSQLTIARLPSGKLNEFALVTGTKNVLVELHPSAAAALTRTLAGTTTKEQPGLNWRELLRTQKPVTRKKPMR